MPEWNYFQCDLNLPVIVVFCMRFFLGLDNYVQFFFIYPKVKYILMDKLTHELVNIYYV